MNITMFETREDLCSGRIFFARLRSCAVFSSIVVLLVLSVMGVFVCIVCAYLLSALMVVCRLLHN